MSVYLYFLFFFAVDVPLFFRVVVIGFPVRFEAALA
jgi:hypothetical protein